LECTSLLLGKFHHCDGTTKLRTTQPTIMATGSMGIRD
jgi:hypothetical protein